MPFARIVEVVAIGRQIFGPQFNAFSKVAGDRVGYPDIAGKPVVSLWHLLGTGDFHLWHVGGGDAGAGRLGRGG